MKLSTEAKELLKDPDCVDPSQPSLEEVVSDSEIAKNELRTVSNKQKKGKKNELSLINGQETPGKSPNKKRRDSKEETEKKEKKTYSLPGQKHEPPDERHPLRIFYESLYQQNPDSEMAEVWMMEHGLLEPDDAKEAFERKRKTQVNQKSGTTSKRPREPDANDTEDFEIKPKKRKCEI